MIVLSKYNIIKGCSGQIVFVQNIPSYPHFQNIPPCAGCGDGQEMSLCLGYDKGQV